MPERENYDSSQILIEILQRLARVEENTKGLSQTDEKADKAYSMAKKHEEEIKELKETSSKTTTRVSEIKGDVKSLDGHFRMVEFVLGAISAFVFMDIIAPLIVNWLSK
ncbi:MAG: hypothetical protein ABF536_06170 [Liquorilactobacillus mali]|uniref:hypothetical protein n=1 Tax=Liquorilactobacillus mali TaxID=1618 RepID=UPI0039EBF219